MGLSRQRDRTHYLVPSLIHLHSQQYCNWSWEIYVYGQISGNFAKYFIIAQVEEYCHLNWYCKTKQHSDTESRMLLSPLNWSLLLIFFFFLNFLYLIHVILENERKWTGSSYALELGTMNLLQALFVAFSTKEKKNQENVRHNFLVYRLCVFGQNLE